MICRGVYKPTVMFFSLKNSPVIFQIMINNILRDLINTKDVVLFMNNILVGTENKKEHNEIVEKVLRRIEKNNLYVKFEKYV